MVDGWWLVVGGWWLVVGGWWLVMNKDNEMLAKKERINRSHQEPWATLTINH